MTRYKMIFTSTDTGEVTEFVEDGIYNLFIRCLTYIKAISDYAKEYKLPRIKPEMLLDALFKDKILYYREISIKIEPNGE